MRNLDAARRPRRPLDYGRAMFLLFGTTLRRSLLVTVVFICGYCDKNVPQRVEKLSTKFTLFFIPLFTVSSRYSNQCTNCGGVTDLTREQAEHAVARQG